MREPTGAFNEEIRRSSSIRCRAPPALYRHIRRYAKLAAQRVVFVTPLTPARAFLSP